MRHRDGVHGPWEVVIASQKVEPGRTELVHQVVDEGDDLLLGHGTGGEHALEALPLPLGQLRPYVDGVLRGRLADGVPLGGGQPADHQRDPGQIADTAGPGPRVAGAVHVAHGQLAAEDAPATVDVGDGQLDHVPLGDPQGRQAAGEVGDAPDLDRPLGLACTSAPAEEVGPAASTSAPRAPADRNVRLLTFSAMARPSLEHRPGVVSLHGTASCSRPVNRTPKSPSRAPRAIGTPRNTAILCTRRPQEGVP